VQQDVRVPFDEPRISVVPGRSTTRIGGGQRRGGSGGIDAGAAHADAPPLVHLDAVEDAGWPQQRDGSRWCGLAVHRGRTSEGKQRSQGADGRSQ
jgi:hypothetical protein